MTDGASSDVQDAANRVVDEAQAIANGVVDLGEDGAKVVLGSLIAATKMLTEALESVSGHLVGE